MSRIDESKEFIAARIAVLTVSDTRDITQDKSGDVLVGRLIEAGHELADRRILPDERAEIAAQLRVWCRATGGVANGTYLFALPGSPGACKDAWDEILSKQLDFRHRPCNFIEIMPRLDEHKRRK